MFSTCPQEHYFDCPYQLSSEAIGQTYKDALVYIYETEPTVLFFVVVEAPVL
jgi:hypothetical protein